MNDADPVSKDKHLFSLLTKTDNNNVNIKKKTMHNT